MIALAKSTIVIATVGLLGYAMLPKPIIFVCNPPEMRARTMMTGLVIGLKAYQTEYDKLPTDDVWRSSCPFALHQTRGEILRALHPDQTAPPPAINSRRINFYDPPTAKDKKNGVYVDAQNKPVLVDPWGNPFYVIIAPQGKDKMPNPDPRDAKEHPFLDQTIAIFSAGPDGDPNTWNDNIPQWK
jgi:hypothetical protein